MTDRPEETKQRLASADRSTANTEAQCGTNAVLLSSSGPFLEDDALSAFFFPSIMPKPTRSQAVRNRIA